MSWAFGSETVRLHLIVRRERKSVYYKIEIIAVMVKARRSRGALSCGPRDRRAFGRDDGHRKRKDNAETHRHGESDRKGNVKIKEKQTQHRLPYPHSDC